MSDAPATVLRPVAEAPDELDLVKRSWRSGLHELVDQAGNVYGTLDYGAFAMGRAVGQSTQGWWTFNRPKGLLDVHLDVTDADGNDALRVALNTFGSGGDFQLGGASYHVGQRTLFSSTMVVSRDGSPLFAVQRTVMPIGENKATVTVSDAGRADPSASLLLLLVVDRVVYEMHQKH